MNPDPLTPRRGPRNSVYVGQRGADGSPMVSVDGRPLDPAPSQSLWNHSPNGFEWGYGGSGPAQLALSLLLHATRGNKECACDLYHRYKWLVVAGWPHSGWVTTRAAILRWIGEQPGHLDGRVSAAEGGGA